MLLPLLTFAVGGKCLLVGGPGRGKTTLAILMGVLAGSSAREVRRNVQQGQPQVTVSDLVGMPLPRDLVTAGSLAEIEIAWRSWLTQPVKIIDEYNRIPTKTQSALLTMVAEGYVESHDQMHSTAPESGVESWFFTANDDAGGGTFPVIQALRDRMDVTVAAQGFNNRFFDELVARVEAGEQPEDARARRARLRRRRDSGCSRRPSAPCRCPAPCAASWSSSPATSSSCSRAAAGSSTAPRTPCAPAAARWPR